MGLGSTTIAPSSEEDKPTKSTSIASIALSSTLSKREDIVKSRKRKRDYLKLEVGRRNDEKVCRSKRKPARKPNKMVRKMNTKEKKVAKINNYLLLGNAQKPKR